MYTSAEYDYENNFGSRGIDRGADVWYAGTCEADIICTDPSVSEGEPCSEGYVCDQMTDAESKTYYQCREGYAVSYTHLTLPTKA